MNSEAKKPLSIGKRISLYFFGNFSTKILGTLLIPLYALYVTPNDLGQMDLQQNIASIVSPILVIGVWEGILKFGIGKTDEVKKEVVSTTFIFVFTMSILSLIISLPLYLYIYKSIVLSIEFSLYIALTPILSISQYYTRLYNENKVFVISSLYGSIGRLVSLFLTIGILKLGINGLILSLLISQIINIIYIYIKTEIFSEISFLQYNNSLLKKMLIFTFPLAINLVSLWFLSGFTRLFINYKYGNSANGIYSFGLQCASLIAMIGQVVNMATLEDVLSSNRTNFYKRFKKQTDLLILVFFDFATMMLPIISILFVFLSDSAYSESFEYVSILMLNSIVVSIASNLNNAFQYKNKTKFIFITTIISATVNVLFAFLLSPILGVRGVVLSQLIGSIVLFFVRYIGVKKLIGYQLNYSKLLFQIFSYTVVSYLTSKINIFINIAILTFVIFYYYKKYRNFLKASIAKFKKENRGA